MSLLKLVFNQVKLFDFASEHSFHSVAYMHTCIHASEWNECSDAKYMDDLRILLDTLDYMFDIIAISESKLKGDHEIDISLKGYHPPYCTNTEVDKGGTILYVTSYLNFKPRKDLEIYESKVLESSLIEIINNKESNDIIGVIYWHPSMDTNIIENNLIYLVNKLTKGDFNFEIEIEIGNCIELSSLFKIFSQIFTHNFDNTNNPCIKL